LASDLSESVEQGVRTVLDAAVRLWDNFGPVEYYIVGSDASATRDLETQFRKQPDGRFGSQKNCLNWVQRDDAFGNMRSVTIDVQEGETSFSNAGCVEGSHPM
jgi:hypothetical protein|tara:strand:- start:1275 stop:1583 length:309 start_codon:yes stop_codon:yes gene_type:complete